MGILVPHGWPGMDLSVQMLAGYGCTAHMLVAFTDILISVYSALL